MTTPTDSVARRIWDLNRVRVLIVLVTVTIGAVAGALVASASTDSYTAEADVFVSVPTTGTPTEVAAASALANDQAVNLAELATRQVVLSPVVDELDLDVDVSDLQRRVRTEVPEDTSIIAISVSDSSAARAADIANAVANSLIDALDGFTTAPGTSPYELQQVESATAPGEPSSPSPLIAVILGMLVGLCVGGAVIALINTYSRSEATEV